jgi:hypothetical protein
MKLHTLLIIGFAAGMVGCAEKEPADSGKATEMKPPEAAVAETAAVDEAPAAESDSTFAQIETWRTEELLDHMHVHAEQLDDLNYALDDGNLERAMTSAYWLSRHETVSGLPAELQPFVDRMREAARSVEAAEDLFAAREAAQQIGVACQGCHTATGVGTQ